MQSYFYPGDNQMARSVTFVIDGTVDTQIAISENSDGTLTFDVSVIGGVIGDLRGLFFDVANPNKLAGLSIAGADINKHVAKHDQVHTLGKDANVNGDVASASGNFDVGIEFGTPGMATDDIQSTSFVVSGLTIDDLSGQDFALRYTSVGVEDGDRSDGAKILGHATAAPDAIADAFSTDEDTPLAGANVLGNDTDADGDVLAVNLVNGVAANVGAPVLITTDGGRTAEITLAADGTLSFTPDDDFDSLAADQTDSFHFTYGVTDNNGGLDTEAAVTITVDGSDDGSGGGPSEGTVTVIDFEDLVNNNFLPIADGYKGFNWDVPGNNLFSADGSAHPVANSGFKHAGSIVAFTPFNLEPVTISRTDGTDFIFDKVELTSAWNSWETTRVSGYNNGSLVGTSDVGITDDGPTAFDPSWGAIDTLEFDLIAYSGVYDTGIASQNFILDNFHFIL
jgi:Bacterial cadherin-like domain